MSQRHYPTRRPTHVYLFATCLVDLFCPQAGLDAVRLLEREGLTVHFPKGQSCCGQPAYSSGNPKQARDVARAQLDLFDQPWPIVVPSESPCPSTTRSSRSESPFTTSSNRLRCT